MLIFKTGFQTDTVQQKVYDQFFLPVGFNLNTKPIKKIELTKYIICNNKIIKGNLNSIECCLKFEVNIPQFPDLKTTLVSLPKQKD